MAGIHHALEKGDYVALSHRSYGLHVLRGMDINILMAEMCGRENGICKGRGGSIHLMDLEHRSSKLQNKRQDIFKCVLKARRMNSI